MVSPSDEHAMELVELKFLEYTKPRKKASFNKDRSGRDLQFHTHKKEEKKRDMHINFTLVSTDTSLQVNCCLTLFQFSHWRRQV